jgi:hypothetical protein
MILRGEQLWGAGPLGALSAPPFPPALASHPHWPPHSMSFPAFYIHGSVEIQVATSGSRHINVALDIRIAETRLKTLAT